MAARTLEEIEALDKTMLTAANVARYLGCKETMLRWQAQTDPAKLGFPVIVIGVNLRIPKEGFIRFCRYGRVVINSTEQK